MNKALSAAFIISAFLHGLLFLPIFTVSSIDRGTPMEISMGSLRVDVEKAERKRPLIETPSHSDLSERISVPSALQGRGVGEDNKGEARNRYLAEIRRRILESRRYPDVARVKGFEGASQVEFVISESGRLEEISLIRSSSYPCLDQEVIAAVKRASPFPPIPEEFCSSRIKVALPVVFKLEEKG